jgi:hypothetical protein
MNANELMVGDWVYVTYPTYPIPAIVEAISPREGSAEGYTFQLRHKPNEVYLVRKGMVKPIPLTPEILEKNGFVYNDIPFVNGWEQFGLTLYRGGNGYLINCGTNVSLIITAVHELQHALRLCGIDKEVII